MSVLRTSLARKPISRKAYWLIGLAVLAICGEIFHHSAESSEYYLDISFWVEIVIYVLIIFGSNSIVNITKEITKRTVERDEVIQFLGSRSALAEELARPLDWDHLVNAILKYPEKIIPSRAVYLHLRDTEQNRFQLVGSTGLLKDLPEWIPAQLAHQDCPCRTQLISQNFEVSSCPVRRIPALDRFCLPLSYGGELVGLMHIDVPQASMLSPAQTEALMSAAPEIALALNNAHLQQAAVSQAEAIVRERQNIAQDLHDTLGQNIAYLNMKLEFMSSDNALQSIEAISREIEKMHGVALEAYEQMRNTLSRLEPAPASCLATAFRDMTCKMAARAGLDYEISTEGEPLQLSQFQQRQVISIFREALNNIEKHSGAARVFVHIAWSTNLLTWQIKDDGRGFDLGTVLNDDQTQAHYGLIIMRERADDLKAHLAVKSAPNQGATITLRLPLAIAAAELSHY